MNVPTGSLAGIEVVSSPLVCMFIIYFSEFAKSFPKESTLNVVCGPAGLGQITDMGTSNIKVALPDTVAVDCNSIYSPTSSPCGIGVINCNTSLPLRVVTSGLKGIPSPATNCIKEGLA